MAIQGFVGGLWKKSRENIHNNKKKNLPLK